MKERKKEKIFQEFLACFLVVSYAVLNFIFINLDYVPFFRAFIFLTLIHFIIFIFFLTIFHLVFQKYSFRFNQFLIILSIIFIFYLPMFEFTTKYYFITLLIILFSFIMTFFLSYQFIYFIISIFILLSAGDGIYKLLLKKDKPITNQILEMQHKNKMTTNKKYPNIYMLVIDTYPSQKNLDKYLDFYNKDFIHYLKNSDFDVKENIMATMCCTWHSFNAIFSYDFEGKNKEFNQYNKIEGWHKRKVIYQLLDRGYGSYSSYGVSNSNDLVSPIILKNFKSKKNQSADYNYVRGFYVKYIGSTLLLPDFLYKVFTNLDKNLVSYIDKNVLLNQVKKVQKTAKNRHFFMLGFTDILAYDVLCDSNTFRKPNSESTIKLLKCANDVWKITIEFIQKNDPNSIIVIMGDHGWPGTDRMRIFNRVHWKNKGDNFIKGQGLFFAMKWNKSCNRFKNFEAYIQ